MRRQLFVLIVLCALLASGVPAARAQTDWPPTIFLFTSDIDSVTIEELESGSIEATFNWHVAHVGAGDTIELHAYQGNAWVPLSDPATSLPPVGEQTVTLKHPANFGPPTYRLAVTNAAGQIVEERTRVIPYANDTDALTPVVFSFSTLDRTIPAPDLAAGTARVRISWVVRDRSPRTHITFTQDVNGDSVNIELPRQQLYVPSQGTGVVAPVPTDTASDIGTITLQLNLIDVISADIIDMATVSVAVSGTAMPEETAPATPAPTEDPTPRFGALTVLETCTLFPPGVPERGWIDSNGVPSPNGNLMVYVTNSVGDAELVIAAANGTGQITVPAPDSDIPLWSRPRWSPDGDWVAFSNISISPPGGGTIYVVNMDGTDVRELAAYTGYYDDVAWSQDGSRLFFTSSGSTGESGDVSAANYQVYSVSTDGLGTPEVVAPGCGVLE